MNSVPTFPLARCLLGRRQLRLLLLVLVTALCGAAPLQAARPVMASTCLGVSVASLEPAVEAAEIVVIGTVAEHAAGTHTHIHPEVYLKGPAAAADVVLTQPDPPPPCPLARFEIGERVLLFLDEGPRGLEWPGATDSFLLRAGAAVRSGTEPVEMPEEELITAIRRITGQYAEPANGDGANMEWGATVLPVTAAIVALFAIGLVLMRIWHRIDPS